jgi:polyisoprenoid-binding protein YceI
VKYAWMAGLFGILGLVGAQTVARADTSRYAVDANASRLVVHVGKSGLFAFAGHEHEVVAHGPRGTVSADPEQITRASVEVVFDAAALRVTGKGEPAGDVPEVQKTMLGPDCLDVARFPDIRFVSTAVTTKRRAADTFDLEIRGELTLHGVKRPLAVPTRVVFQSDAIAASGTITIRQTDFGIKPISKAGVVNVKDELDLTWRLIARR